MRSFVALVVISVAPLVGHAHCYQEAGQRYQINPELLKAIAHVESRGRPEATNRGHLSRTGTYDIGVMQINSSWLPKLKKFEVTEEMLRDPCQNVMVGAWILANHMNESGANWRGVGAYNASCRTLSAEKCAQARGDYTWKVYRALLRETGNTAAKAEVDESQKKSVRKSIPKKMRATEFQAERRIASVLVEDDVVAARIQVSSKSTAPDQTGSVWRDAGMREIHAARKIDHFGEN